jgi:YesN/AraC family two-component response regulator
VELHHGTIKVECRRGLAHQAHDETESDMKTVFTVLLPIGKEHLSEEEIVEEPSIVSTEDHLPQPTSSIPDKNASIPSAHRDQIIHDLTSNQKPASSILSPASGQDGWEKALDKVPELIISDVMMPVMDGFELCKKLKSDQRTSHIPLILLTAKADMDSKIEGLEFGADDYISKPFEARELQARANNLINQRKMLHEKFRRMIEIKPEEVAASSMDEKFLKHLLRVFEDHISEPDFSTEEFASEVGMSRMHLNRKLQALTNQSTHEFIRTLRLKRAAQLLKKTTGSVSEIAYSLGFNSPSHFANAFRKQFGQPPSIYSKNESQR